MPYQYRVRVKYFQNGVNTPIYLPGIVTESGILISHIRYLAYFEQRSLSWKKDSVTALILLLRYIKEYPRESESPVALLKKFARVLSEGTIDYENFDDCSGLYWRPRSSVNVRKIIRHITNYSDFLAREQNMETGNINPFREATTSEEQLNWCAYQHRKNNAFLSHILSDTRAKMANQRVREVLTAPIPSVNRDRSSTKKFPVKHIDNLFRYGFVMAGGHTDYSAIAMTMLMHFGGLRVSEIFHLYIGDIVEDTVNSGAALVRVYHPELGKSPTKKYRNRLEYLRGEFQKNPRSRIDGKLHAGWKSPLLGDDRYYFEVIFSSDLSAKVFYGVWLNYLRHQRVDPKYGREHPFAFTNSNGDPETIANFRAKHSRAVRRIGLEPHKHLGTTEHGHRHAYGYELAEKGMSQVDIQKCMHHRNPNSCLVYIMPSEEELRAKLKMAKLK